MVPKEGPSDEGCKQLSEGPEDGEDRQKILVRAREKFQEYGGVNLPLGQLWSLRIHQVTTYW